MGLGVLRMLGMCNFNLIAQRMKEVEHSHWVDLYELDCFISAQIGFCYIWNCVLLF